MAIKIGFYVCHCGINIANKVDVKEVRRFASTLENVVVSRDYKFMCSDPGQELIEKDIREFGLTRVVVASCSPRLHEKTFQSACQRAGLNPYYFQMASVREQVSWVTIDEVEAVKKAKTLVAGAINRVNFHENLADREVAVHPDIMVVGGGIAGMQAALDIGNSGHKVYLVEKDTTIGGHMLQFDKTFPTLDCAACIGTPKMVEVAQNPCIELLSYSEVKEVTGYVGNYKVRVLKKPRYINMDLCTGCGECASVCPVNISSEWDEKLNTRKAIYRAFPQAVPITFCIDKKDRAPCTVSCPANLNVQGYVQLIAEKKYAQAVELILERVPLPGVLGRVCPHPCEYSCRRKDVDEKISIRNLKRFAADQINYKDLTKPVITDRQEKIAVIGSGPAGLSTAYYLRLKGYQVTIFESLDYTGGMLRAGIPDYRLPPNVLDEEIDNILDAGIELKTKTALGRDITPEDLKDQGYEVLFLSIGAHRPLNLSIPGEDVNGVVDAVDFLREINFGVETIVGTTAVIVGGGNVAIDAARVAKRSGAQRVIIIYRRTADEIPADEEEISGALEENIEFLYLTSPVKIISEDSKVTGIECIFNKLGKADASNRRRPIPVEGTEFTISCDMVIPAIGQRPAISKLAQILSLEISKWGTIKVNPDMQTNVPHIFAAGDAVTGPATVIEAIASSHVAVAAIDHFINHGNLDQMPEKPVQKQGNWDEIPKLPVQNRALPVTLAPEKRANNFIEVDEGLTEEMAVYEAKRCLNCGGCSECMECVKVCEANAIDHSMKEEEVEIDVGSMIVATGFDVLDPTPLKPYGYGKYPNVFTNLEFERLSNATGPTSGKILIRDDEGELTREPQSVAILHCIGSRDVNYHKYCSRVCCMYALKYGHLIHEKIGPDTKVYNFYIDLRCYGKGYEEFYARCQEEGTKFIRGKVASIKEKGDRLIVYAEDTLASKPVQLSVDMVVLCTAMQARKDSLEVGRIFGVSQGSDQFFLENHPKLAPLETATDGVFLAGTCQGPKDVPDTVSQASGAAAKALSLAVKGKVEVSSTISWIDPDVCAGCKTCIGLCPYSAIEFNQVKGVSEVNEALCKGCGSCSGFCPSGAAQVRHFKEQQIFAELDGILDTIHSVGI